MFKNKLIAATIAFMLSFGAANAGNYFGIGFDYAIPTSDFKETASDALGFQLKLENRSYCSFWFGINLNYWSVSQKSDQQTALTKVDNLLMVSPKVQFNIFDIKSQDYKSHLIIPFIGAGATFSNIEADDGKNPFGIGGFANVGLSYGFKLFGRCASFDAEMKYNMPNIIYKADKRESYQLFNVGLSLGVCL